MVPFDKFQTLFATHAFHFNFSLRCPDEMLLFVHNYFAPIAWAILVRTIVVLVDFQGLHIGCAVIVVQYHDVVWIASLVLRLGMLERIFIGLRQGIFVLKHFDRRELRRICQC